MRAIGFIFRTIRLYYRWVLLAPIKILIRIMRFARKH